MNRAAEGDPWLHGFFFEKGEKEYMIIFDRYGLIYRKGKFDYDADVLYTECISIDVDI
jgi:hypothetical protein